MGSYQPLRTDQIAGMEVTQTPDSLMLSQEKYIENVLQKEGMTEANPVGTPMDLNMKLEPNPNENELNCSNSYARLLGSLQYIANST
jgi:hypothetical protein